MASIGRTSPDELLVHTKRSTVGKKTGLFEHPVRRIAVAWDLLLAPQLNGRKLFLNSLLDERADVAPFGWVQNCEKGKRSKVDMPTPAACSVLI